MNLYGLVRRPGAVKHHRKGGTIFIAPSPLPSLQPRIRNIAATGFRMESSEAAVGEIHCAGEDSLRLCLGKGQTPRAHGSGIDLFVAAGAVTGHRRRREHVTGAPGLRNNFDGTDHAVVQRGQMGKTVKGPIEGSGETRRERETAGPLGRHIRIRPIEGDLISLDDQLTMDLHPGLIRMPLVMVNIVNKLVRPIGNLSNLLAEDALGVVHRFLKGIQNGLLPIFLNILQEAGLHQPDRSILGCHVAEALIGHPDVKPDQLHGRFYWLVFFVNPCDWNKEPFGVTFGCLRVKGSGNRPSHVGPMAAGDGKGEELSFHEDRPDKAHIQGMGAAAIGIIHNVDIPWTDLFNIFAHALERRLVGAHVRSDVTNPVRHKSPVGREQPDGIIVALSYDRAIGHPLDQTTCLGAHGAKAVADNLKGNRIHGGNKFFSL